MQVSREPMDPRFLLPSVKKGFHCERGYYSRGNESPRFLKEYDFITKKVIIFKGNTNPINTNDKTSLGNP